MSTPFHKTTEPQKMRLFELSFSGSLPTSQQSILDAIARIPEYIEDVKMKEMLTMAYSAYLDFLKFSHDNFYFPVPLELSDSFRNSAYKIFNVSFTETLSTSKEEF